MLQDAEQTQIAVCRSRRHQHTVVVMAVAVQTSEVVNPGKFQRTCLIFCTSTLHCIVTAKYSQWTRRTRHDQHSTVAVEAPAGPRLQRPPSPMNPQNHDVSELLLHAACGMPVAPEPGLLFNLLLSTRAALPAQAYGLEPNQICRLLLHAGAKAKQLQVRSKAAHACSAR